jgi:hypothetical protein
MSESQGFFGRVSRWFRQRFGAQEDLPLLYGETETSTAIARRPLFGFPWQRKEEDLTVLQTGLASMTALMTSLRQYLDQQNARHDELLTYLSQLSQALQAIPDAGRMQSETLRVLHQQIAYQNAQHKQLSETLRKVSESSGTQREVVELLRDRVEILYKNDQQIADTIGGMGGAITLVSQQSQTNTMVLERVRDNLVTRDGDLEKAIRREQQKTRVTLYIVGASALAALIIAVAMTRYSLTAIQAMGDSVKQMRPLAPIADKVHSAPGAAELTLQPVPHGAGANPAGDQSAGGEMTFPVAPLTGTTAPSTVPSATTAPVEAPAAVGAGGDAR